MRLKSFTQIKVSSLVSSYAIRDKFIINNPEWRSNNMKYAKYGGYLDGKKDFWSENSFNYDVQGLSYSEMIEFKKDNKDFKFTRTDNHMNTVPRLDIPLEEREIYYTWEIGYSYFNRQTANLSKLKHGADSGKLGFNYYIEKIENPLSGKIYGKMIVGLDNIDDNVIITFEDGSKEAIPCHFVSNMEIDTEE